MTHDRRRAPAWVMPLGMGPLMPALVLGYETHLAVHNPAWLRWTADGELPPWLMLVYQQAGGYGMSNPTVLGAMFRLAANTQRALRDPSSLIAAFHAMAEDPQLDVLRRHRPELVELCGTHGEPYSSSQLRTLSETLGEHFDLPACEEGIEAFVRLQRSDPTPVLGWRWVEATPGTLGIAEGKPSPESQWTDGGMFAAEDVRALTEIGSILLAKIDPPALYLIWENSD